MMEMVGRWLIAACAVTVVALFYNAVSGRGGDGHQGTLSNVERIPYDAGLRGEDEGLRLGLQKMSLRYGKPAIEPAVSLVRALAVARAEDGPMLDRASSVLARHVLWSNDTESEGDRLLFQNVPAWVITYRGLDIPNRGPRGGKKVYNHELHVVIDATTGEWLRSYTFR